MTERQYNDLKAEIDSKIATLSDECSTLTAEVREHFKNSEYEKMSEKTELFIAKNDEILDLLREKENLRKDIRTNGFDEEDYDQLDDLYDLPDEELVHTKEPKTGNPCNGCCFSEFINSNYVCSKPMVDRIDEFDDSCLSCDCFDPDMGCTMPSIDKCYACPVESAQEEQKQQAETADRFHHIKDLFGVYPNIEKCFPGGQLPTERNIHYLYGYLTALYDVDALCQDHYLDCIDELQQYEQYIESQYIQSFCAGDRVKHARESVGEGTVVHVDRDYLVVLFDHYEFEYDEENIYDCYELITRQYLDLLEKK